jgi:hypothetical protein
VIFAKRNRFGKKPHGCCPKQMIGFITMVGTARCAVRRRFGLRNRRRKALADAAARRPYQVLVASTTLLYFGRRFVLE